MLNKIRAYMRLRKILAIRADRVRFENEVERLRRINPKPFEHYCTNVARLSDTMKKREERHAFTARIIAGYGRNAEQDI